MQTEDVKSILAYALLDRIWLYLNRSMPLGPARADALAIVTVCENALLENWPIFCDRLTIVNINMLTSLGRDITDAQSDRIRADIAALSPETFSTLRTLAGNTPDVAEDAETLLDRATAAQEAYWDALRELEQDLGFDIDLDGDALNGYTVEDLQAKFA
jgi:hypothetical protein